MLLKKIKSSSIAETVIALSVISICFGIASIAFIRSVKVTSNFQDIKKQTEIQSELWINLYSDDKVIREMENIVIETTPDLRNDSMDVITFTNESNKTIWQQQWIRE